MFALIFYKKEEAFIPPLAEVGVFCLDLDKELDKRFQTLKSGKISKAGRIEEVVLSAFIPVTKKEIRDLLPDVSVSTIERVLSEMLKEGKISKLGTTNRARYVKAKK